MTTERKSIMNGLPSLLLMLLLLLLLLTAAADAWNGVKGLQHR